MSLTKEQKREVARKIAQFAMHLKGKATATDIIPASEMNCPGDEVVQAFCEALQEECLDLGRDYLTVYELEEMADVVRNAAAGDL